MLLRFWTPRYWPTWLLLLCMRLCAFLPYAGIIAVGSMLGSTFRRLSASRRHIASTNIELCFPELSDEERLELQRACFRNLGISVLETAWAWWAPDSRTAPRLHSISGLRNVEKAQLESRPILLLTGHVCCMEIGARLLAAYVPFQAMYKPAKNELVESVMLTRRSRIYKEMIPRKQSMRMIRNMKRNVATWYGPDQNFGHDDTVFAPFFGIPATTLTATARIASATNAIVLPFFPYRLPGTRGYRLVIGEPLDGFPSGDAMRDATAVNRMIEEYVRVAPDQYLWVHQRFRVRPAGEPAIY